MTSDLAKPARWTIGRLMIMIAGLALILAAMHQSGPFGALVATLVFGVGLAWWICSGAARRLRWGFVVSAVGLNSAVFATSAYMPVYHTAAYLLLGILFWLPTYFGAGIAWANQPWGHPGQSRANVVVVALIAGTILMVVTQWPWSVASYVSSPALNRLADRVQARGGFQPGEWAGLYRIWSVMRYPDGTVVLFTVPPPNGSAAFVRFGVPRPPVRRWESIPINHQPGSGRWFTSNSE